MVARTVMTQPSNHHSHLSGDYTPVSNTIIDPEKPNSTISRLEMDDEPSLLGRGSDEATSKKRRYKPPLDVNIYATKKTVAQGMLDIALLTANASQLKYVLREGTYHEYYILNLSLLGTSILLQLIVGILLILKGRYNLNIDAQQHRADNLNNATVVCIFLITVVNVVLSSFGVPGDGMAPAQPTSPDNADDAWNPFKDLDGYDQDSTVT